MDPNPLHLANHHHTLAQQARSRGDLDQAASHDWYCAMWSANVRRQRKPQSHKHRRRR